MEEVLKEIMQFREGLEGKSVHWNPLEKDKVHGEKETPVEMYGTIDTVDGSRSTISVSYKVDGEPADGPNRALTVMTLEDTVMRNLDLEGANLTYE